MSLEFDWPDLPEKDRWVIENMEEILRDPWYTPEYFRERAQQLRTEAAESNKYARPGLLRLAGNYEKSAAVAAA